jgi:polyisoprenoid-binding protein YceI
VESKINSGWFRRVGAAAIFVSAIFAMTAAQASAGEKETWNIDPVHSNISFSARHMMISDVKGEFDKFSGSISANPDDPSTVEIQAAIDTASINTRSDMRDKDLKGPNFLDVAKYPTMTFRSTKIEPDGQGKWKVTGDLTLHGVTKPVVLEVMGPSTNIKDPYGNTRRGASATTTINRQDFGIAFNKTLDAGGMVVGNDVAVTIDVEAIKKVAK